MSGAVSALLQVLDLEPLEVNLFRGRSPQTGWQRVFGGQVIGQALVAATRTVEPEYEVHSLHSYFLRPGDPHAPILYQVDRTRDGHSFTTRRAVAIQHGTPIFGLSASASTAAGPTSRIISSAATSWTFTVRALSGLAANSFATTTS